MDNFFLTNPVYIEDPYNLESESQDSQQSHNSSAEDITLTVSESLRTQDHRIQGFQGPVACNRKMDVPPDLLPSTRSFRQSQYEERVVNVDTVDLLQSMNPAPPGKSSQPPIRLPQDHLYAKNCSGDIFQCTLNKVPEDRALLQKSKLPFGICLQPFKDMEVLDVIQTNTIMRCKMCRSYINPFVHFVDSSRYRCNLCCRINVLHEEFYYNPVTKRYGHPRTRPEVLTSTVEFIAPVDYVVTPPQPTAYLFLLDVSKAACGNKYIETLAEVLVDELDNLPRDGRTKFGLILFDSKVHFFYVGENILNEMVIVDIDDVFIPSPNELLFNLKERKGILMHLLKNITKRYASSEDSNTALGSALMAGFKLLIPIGGRITVFLSGIPNTGLGCLKSSTELTPTSDFYKKMSLEFCTHHIACDLFVLTSTYCNLITVSEVSKFSGGSLYYFPGYQRSNYILNKKFKNILRRYLTRRIGLEAVVRLRHSKDISIRQFHGNFFVRGSGLLCVPNINPDVSISAEIQIDDTLRDSVCFQAAVLYTTSTGERRIRVHTLCLPVSSNIQDIFTYANQRCIFSILSKMAVEKTMSYTLCDAKDSLINVLVDICSAYKYQITNGSYSGLLLPKNLSYLPMYILSLLKSTAFRNNHLLDDHAYAFMQLRTLPLNELINFTHPDLYEFDANAKKQEINLSIEYINHDCLYILDTLFITYLYVGRHVHRLLLKNIFGVDCFNDIKEVKELDNDVNMKLRGFLKDLDDSKPFSTVLVIVKEYTFLHNFLTVDKTDDFFSYSQFINHIKNQID